MTDYREIIRLKSLAFGNIVMLPSVKQSLTELFTIYMK